MAESGRPLLCRLGLHRFRDRLTGQPLDIYVESAEGAFGWPPYEKKPPWRCTRCGEESWGRSGG